MRLPILVLCSFFLTFAAATKHKTCQANCDLAEKGSIGVVLDTIVQILRAVLELLAKLLQLDVFCELGQNIEEILCLVVDILCEDKRDLLDDLELALKELLVLIDNLLKSETSSGCLHATILKMKTITQGLVGCSDLSRTQVTRTLLAGMTKLLAAILEMTLCLFPSLMKIILTILPKIFNSCDLGGALNDSDVDGILQEALASLGVTLKAVVQKMLDDVPGLD